MEQKHELQALVREAANGWLEHTAKDEEILESMRDQTIAWCAGYLLAKKLTDASAELFRLVPKDRLEQLLS